MRKILTGILVTLGLILFLAIGFTVYAQFALDYSLESLRQALEVTRESDLSKIDAHAQKSAFENLVFEEVTRKDANLGSVVLLEHAQRAIRDAMEKSGYAKAGAYISEVLREKSSKRHWFFRTADSVYYFSKNFGKSVSDFWTYLLKRLRRKQEMAPLSGTGVLILAEAERAEKERRYDEAERYYREFLDRYPGRAERGFVDIALANVLLKTRRLEETIQLLNEVRKEYPGGREEALAVSLLSQTESVKRRLAELPKLEGWIKDRPERIFNEEGGLELALGYLATFQRDRAQSILEKLEEAPDPRLRSKALFYKGLLHKWAGDFTKGKEIFQRLGEKAGTEEEAALAAQAELADIYYEGREYKRALISYEKFSRLAKKNSWKALSELEQSDIYLFRLGDSQAAKKTLEDVKHVFSESSSEFRLAQNRLSDALQKSSREVGFQALAEGRVTAAENIFKKHLANFPRDGQSRAAYASILLLRGSLEEALDQAEKAYSYLQDEYTASILGYVYENIAETEKAEQFYSIGLNFNPAYVIAKFNLAVMYLRKGRFEETMKLLEGMEKHTPAPPSVIRAKVFNNRGCALWGLGKKEEAKIQFREALKVLPTMNEAQENLKLDFGERGPARTFTEVPVLLR